MQDNTVKWQLHAEYWQECNNKHEGYRQTKVKKHEIEFAILYRQEQDVLSKFQPVHLAITSLKRNLSLCSSHWLANFLRIYQSKFQHFQIRYVWTVLDLTHQILIITALMQYNTLRYCLFCISLFLMFF